MAAGEGRQTVEVDGRTLALTNLGKVMYPSTGMTKGEVVSYYAEIAPVMLPLVAGRPVTRKRWVHGVGTADAPGQVFFEKNLAGHAPEWLGRGIIEHSDGPKTYPIADTRAALVWLAQQAALEIHVPQWRFAPDGTPGNPDRMVFDFDPGEGVGLAECAEVARLVRDILTPIGLDPIPVTSGSKGIHLYAPLDGRQSSQQVSDVAHELARALEADHPKLVVSSMKKELRTGKVLIDWSQNSAAKTTIAPYSLRGRLRPTVAAPRTWDELDDPGLAQFEWQEVLERVAAGNDPAAALGGARPEASGPLSTYLSMRDPAKTPEPMPAAVPVVPVAQAGAAPADGALRFVVDEHHARSLHFDLRLERDGVLRSWAVPKGVPDDPGVNRLAVQTEDHPLEYLEFHGEIPKGQYGAGKMSVWDTGTYTAEKWRDDEIIATLKGREGGPLRGSDGRGVRVALIRTSGEGQKSQWLLHRMKEQRPDASAHAPAAAAAEISERPMLAVPGKPVDVARGDWALEWKWDGIRILARTDGGAVRLTSRSGRDETARYPELAGLARALRADALVDGELVALDADGRPDFGRMQPRMNVTRPREIAELAASVPVRLLLFDVLEVAGTPTIDEPYVERRARLERLFRPVEGVPVEVPALAASEAGSETRADPGVVEAALAEARALGLEGLVAKRRGSRYRPGVRSDDWVKLKLTRTQEVLIGGYRKGTGTREGRIKSLLVGTPTPDGRLEYAGRVWSGLGEHELDRLLATFDGLHAGDSPFVAVPPAEAADAVWVRPELVGEIEFSGWTTAGSARHPRWRGLRPDLDAASIVRERD
ncbi:ATP-dependent DNA ligase [Agromyces protaetiae]|uniref:DNA ligase (ATP) n=1 Tax=Agromyces protaetiae TaxID=2509455 RepID=A0A4P6FF20_9MICO|nr:ATP-dependent DNA ligase [Agromyces protaetiae]QAY72337.1 ATP-dependent DNA ligase [Agromyces protaetiae]